MFLSKWNSDCYWCWCFFFGFLVYFFQIDKAEFSCPPWFPVGAKMLIHRILDPNPETVSVCLAEQVLWDTPFHCQFKINVVWPQKQKMNWVWYVMIQRHLKSVSVMIYNSHAWLWTICLFPFKSEWKWQKKLYLYWKDLIFSCGMLWCYCFSPFGIRDIRTKYF